MTEHPAALTSLAQDHSVPFDLSSLVERTDRDALTAARPVGGELLASQRPGERSRATLATP